MKGAVIIEGHVQGLSNVRSLGEKGMPVYVMDVCNCLAQHSRYCKKFFKCPAFDSSDFIEFLIEVGKKEHLEGWALIPSNDHIVENLSKSKIRLDPYYKTIAPDEEVLDNVVNKKNLLSFAEKCGTPIPRTCYPESKDIVASFRFPVLLKGNYGLSFYKATHSKAIQVDSLDDLASSLETVVSKVGADNVMIQELLPFDPSNRVVSFTCFAVNGEIKTYWMGDKLREHPLKYGTATCSRSVNIPAVLSSARPLVKELGYTGVCEIEFMRDMRDGVYKLIEINPRTWLWVGLAKACGVDYAYMIYCYLNDLPITYPTSYVENLKWINSITDFYFSAKLIMRGDLSFRDYLKSLKGKKVNAVWSWNDIMPGLLFPFMLFYINKKRK